jgi:molybdopterin converting factor small subunit
LPRKLNLTPMKITIKLFPPYRKKGEPDEQQLLLKQQSINLENLSLYLAQKWPDRFDYPLIDERGRLTAEFMVNGRHVSLDYVLGDKDTVSIIPYICGG